MSKALTIKNEGLRSAVQVKENHMETTSKHTRIMKARKELICILINEFHARGPVVIDGTAVKHATTLLSSWGSVSPQQCT